MKKVLVTGANGFLGSNLVAQLNEEGYEVRVIVRKNADTKSIAGMPCEIMYGNIDNKDDVHRVIDGCDVVIHAACITDQWSISFEEYERVNFMATKYIADACLQLGVKRLVYVSTANTMGPGSKEVPGNELSGFTLFKANSGYINSKYLTQQYVLEHAALKKLPAVVVNPTFMIGPNDVKPSSGKLMLFCMGKKVLFYPPGGKNFVYIKDVCTGIINAIDKGKIGECYLLAGHNLTYKEFFTLVSDTAGEKKTMVQLPGFILKLAGRAGSLIERIGRKTGRLNYTSSYLLCLDNYYSGKKAERELAISYTPIEHAVKDALGWFKANNYY
jgi:dihydroflavonol-4-reductase